MAPSKHCTVETSQGCNMTHLDMHGLLQAITAAKWFNLVWESS
jgi:hypothetical protein